MKSITVNCIIVWIWILSGCGQPIEDPGYIVEPKEWPTCGFKWSKCDGE